MNNVTTLQSALDRLVVMSDADGCPELDYSTEVSELQIILADHKRGEVWAASTVRLIGDVVIATSANRNGRRFKAVRYISTATNQQNGATEPVWSTGQGLEYTDGNVVWREDGWDWDAVLWDLQAAAREAWLTKQGKATLKTNFQLPSGMSVSSSQIYDHCEAMAKRFRSVSVA